MAKSSLRPLLCWRNFNFVFLLAKLQITMDVEHFTSNKPNFPSRKCGVLGATGSVGQRFILLLANHPHFTLTTIGASERSAGRRYQDTVKWKQAQPMSQELGHLVIQKCIPEAFKECDLIFSGLDSDVAGDIGIWFVTRPQIMLMGMM